MDRHCRRRAGCEESIEQRESSSRAALVGLPYRRIVWLFKDHCREIANKKANQGSSANGFECLSENTMKPSFTIGIEEEYQTIDPETRDLRSHMHSEIIAKGKRIMEEQIKAEMKQSVVEVDTGVW